MNTIEYLESEFEFLINDYGFKKIGIKDYIKEFTIIYKSRRREVIILYSRESRSLSVKLINLNLIANIFCGGEGYIRYNLDTITNGDIKVEEFKVEYNWRTYDEETLNKTKLYRKIMQDYLHEVLLGKKWIRLK
jgi:hypothetical protein